MVVALVTRRTKPGVLATALVICCAASISGFCQGQAAPATSAQPATQTPAAAPFAAHSKHHISTKPVPQPEVVESAPPPPPPPPDWPVNDQPRPASVDWNGRDLQIAATNSSLQQILKDISTATGVEVDGFATDQRIFGNYGPAPARDVLNQLLDGSGYNVMMIGDKGQGTPRSLVLSSKSNQPGAHSALSDSRPKPTAEEEAPEDPEPVEAPEPAGGARRPVPSIDPNVNRSPQQIMQEMQQRQQQMQQQNQQQPQNQQPPQAQPTPQPPNN
jgi:hypothetical protein